MAKTTLTIEIDEEVLNEFSSNCSNSKTTVSTSVINFIKGVNKSHYRTKNIDSENPQGVMYRNNHMELVIKCLYKEKVSLESVLNKLECRAGKKPIENAEFLTNSESLEVYRNMKIVLESEGREGFIKKPSIWEVLNG